MFVPPGMDVLVHFLPMKSRKWLAHDTMYTSATHASLVHDICSEGTAVSVRSSPRTSQKWLANDIMHIFTIHASLAQDTCPEMTLCGWQNVNIQMLIAHDIIDRHQTQSGSTQCCVFATSECLISSHKTISWLKNCFKVVVGFCFFVVVFCLFVRCCCCFFLGGG